MRTFHIFTLKGYFWFIRHWNIFHYVKVSQRIPTILRSQKRRKIN